MGKKKVGDNGHHTQGPPVPTPTPDATKKPVHTVRLGRIRASVWQNQGDDGDAWYSVTLSRIYRQARADGTGDEYKAAQSFGKDDLLVCAECCRLAYLWVVSQTVHVTKPPQQDSEPVPF